LLQLPEERAQVAQMIEVDGLPVGARMMFGEVQEEAYRLGLIPYVSILGGLKARGATK
jgi:hypothetical protein